jgi:protein involved in polysaccharide export with SLBB domain
MNSANEGSAKVKPLSISLRLFVLLGFLWSALFSTWAREPDRVGVLALDAQQRAWSIKAAPSGKDVRLDIAPAAPVAAAVPVMPPEPSAVQEKANEALVTVSLEERIQKQALQTELKQFGYELFSNTSATYSPSETLPVPPDYVIAPGDTFVVQVFGATDLEYRLVVTRDGRILVPEIGEIPVSGLTFDAAKSIIQQRIGRIRIGVKTVVTLADLHTIQIVVMGEVIKPGSYNVGGMTTLFNALVGTGGIKTTGSLRKIELRRDNELVTRMDLYDVLLSGRTKNNLFLRQGDVIFVPPSRHLRTFATRAIEIDAGNGWGRAIYSRPFQNPAAQAQRWNRLHIGTSRPDQRRHESVRTKRGPGTGFPSGQSHGKCRAARRQCHHAGRLRMEIGHARF